MTLAEMNRRIQLQQPDVELVKGEGYHYYLFDNSTPDDKSVGRDGQALVYESESVMVMYTSHVPAAEWIADGIAFGARVRAENGL